MPQVTGALVIKDGSATPADVSYSVEQLSSQESIFVDRRQASRDMQPSIGVDFSRPTTNRNTFKCIRNVAYPVVRTINGVDQVVDTLRANVTYTIPKSASAQERKHLRALVANAEDLTILRAGPEDLDPLY